MTEKDGVIILGGSSAIARALAERFAQDGRAVALAGRDLDDLQHTAADLSVRFGVAAHAVTFDAVDFGSHQAFFDQCIEKLGQVEGIALCHGYMAEQAKAQNDFTLAHRMIETNYASAVSILEIAAAYLAEQKQGFIVGVSSVAGDRGRQSNYIYGSTKAALTAYLQGLRNRLYHHDVHVLTVKPGFVDTAMTWGLIKDGPLTAAPQQVARDIHKALRRRRNEIYTVAPWRGVMAIIRNIPESMFKKMKM